MEFVNDWIARDVSSIWHGFTQMSVYPEQEPIIVERAEGHYLVDVEGRRYFDAVSSLWANTIGHCDPEMNEAIIEQLRKLAHATLLGNGSVAAIEAAEALKEVVPVEDARFVFASDGASAVEQAIKIAYQFHRNLGEPRRKRILALTDAYHGDTLGAVSVGGRTFYTEIFSELCFEPIRTPGYRDPGWAEKAVEAIDKHCQELAALILEPVVQAAGGMWIAREGDVSRVISAAQEAGVLVIADEVATGFGRCGAWFASDLAGARPDIMCLGKGITGGYLPMSATACSRRVWEAFLGEDLGPRTFYHGHTYGGNALAAAAAKRHLAIVRERAVLENVRRQSDLAGKLLRGLAEQSARVRDVRLKGLMGGIELAQASKGSAGRRVAAACVRRGVFVRPLGDVLVFMPPLTVTEEEVESVVATMAQAIEDVEREGW
jgi:adenosylmethionine-8-amino-7-oxononanoate aminotransferase